MPSSQLSPRLTSAYRARLAGINQRVQVAQERLWPSIEELDATRWPQRVAVVVGDAQKEAARATSGYLTAYLISELGRRVPPVAIDSTLYAGLSRDGRPLEEALRSPIIGVLAALKDGRSALEALQVGRQRAARMVEVDLMHAARRALTDTIDADDRLDGWQRVTRGTCGACMALSGTSGPHFDVHPGCQCVPQPVVKGVPDVVPVKSGAELFAALTTAEQDAQFGPAKAAALRTGAIALTDLVEKSTLATDQPNYLTETPLQDAA